MPGWHLQGKFVGGEFDLASDGRTSIDGMTMTGSGGRGYWQDLSSPDIEALDHARTIAILPVGAIEQHGPHLPLGVDAMINQGILDSAMVSLPGGTHECGLILVVPFVDGHAGCQQRPHDLGLTAPGCGGQRRPR